MLSMVCNEHQNNWDAHLLHVEYAYNNSISAATGLASNEVHIGRLPRLPLAVFDRSHGGAHQSLDRDHLVFCDLARERQQRAYELVREQYALTVARVNGGNSTLSGCFSAAPNTWLGAGYGYTTPPSPSDKDCAKAPVTNSLQRNFLSTGQAPSKSSLLVPPQRLTNPTDVHSETSCYILTSPRTCPALLENPASL